MRNMKNAKKTVNYCKFFLITALFYFLQVYPIAHFHHSHGEGLFSIEFSLHPLEIEADHLPEHHGHGDQHGDDTNQSTWYLTRTHLQRFVFSVEHAALPEIIQPQAECCYGKKQYEAEECFIFVKFIVEPQETRGPPILF